MLKENFNELFEAVIRRNWELPAFSDYGGSTLTYREVGRWILIFHGVDDQTVPYAQVVDFCEAMQTSGNVCEVIGFEGKGHGFFNYGRDDNTAFIETLRHTDRFFAALAFLADTPD